MYLATILAIWAALTAHFSVSSNALSLPSLNALSLGNSDNKLKIDLLDVKCDKNENGMHVTIQFSQPFEGIIYSQGYFNDPKCRYVSAGEGEQSYNFVVPFEGCGSKRSCAVCDSIDNVLVIQQDEEVQGDADAARKISCSRTGIEEEKKIYFKPFIVQSLDVITVPTKHGGVDCWMDIQRGIYPKLTAIGEVIKIGEELTVLVYLRDPKKEYDLTVRNCWAYDNDDFDDKKTGKVQLSDSSGCTMKRKLFGSWHKTDQTGSSGATLLLHNTLRAFKFPDQSQVYLKCDIEICRGNCAEAICDDEINQIDINNVDCTLDPLHEKCIREKLSERVDIVGFTTTANQPHQPSSTSKVTTRLPFIEHSRRPSFVAATTQRPTYISTTLLYHDANTVKPFECTPDSLDIRCIQQQYAETTQATETNNLRETTTYQNLFKTTTIKPGYDSFCALYPKHKRCNQRVTEDLSGNYEILTFKPPSPFATVKYQPATEVPRINLEYASTTESAAYTEQSLNCDGPYLDPRCPNPTPTATPPTYLPPKSTKKLVITTPPTAPRCYPGSPDPRCPRIEGSRPPTTRQPFTTTTQPITTTGQPITTTTQPITTTINKFFICVPGRLDDDCENESTKVTEEPPPEKTTITIPSRNQFGTTKAPEKPDCFFGSTNPECQKVSTQILTFKPQPSTTSIPITTTKKPFISNTRAPICYPGSLDTRCVQSTTNTVSFKTESSLSTGPTIPSIPAISSTTRAPICYPGSIDPRCPQQITTKRIIPEIPTTQKIITGIPETTTYIPTTINTPICYAGSQDPRCRQSTTEKGFVSFGTESSLSTRPPIYTPTISSSTRAPICYPGSLDTRCQKPSTTRIVPEFKVTERIAPEPTTYKVPTTTGAPICYLGSQDPRCGQSTTVKTPLSFGTTRPPIPFTPSVPSTTRAPICYPGSPDPRCPKQITTKKTIPEIITTQKVITETRGPVCYPGALDPRCQKPTTAKPFIPSISTTHEVSSEHPTTKTYRCYPGSLDPQCAQSTTKNVFVSFGTESSLSTRPPIVPTENAISTTTTPLKCYPGSLDPRCASKQLVVPLQCGPGYLDPRCPNPTPTAEPATYLPPIPTTTYKTQRPPITTTPAQPFVCTSNSLDPRCKTGTTLKFIPSVTTEGTTATFSPQSTQKLVSTTTGTQRPTYPTRPSFSFPPFTTRPPVKISTTNPPFICTPYSTDPRCRATTKFVPSVTTGGKFSPETTTTYIPSTSQRPTYTTTTRPPFSFPTFTTRPPLKISTTLPPFICTSNSLDPRCKIATTTQAAPSSTRIPGSTTTSHPETTPKVIPISTPTTTQRPTYTTTRRPPFSFPTFSTGRISSPQPFTTRPTTKLTSTTTENILCYPGSTIEGCKQTITTPSYCYPGSKDPRCPTLPPSFSTRQPTTYLPPFPDARLNRVRRQISVENEQTDEIVKFSLSFKPFKFS